MAKAARPRQPCPHCESDKYKTLKKNGAGNRVTRCCEQPVVTVNHKWYIRLDDAPEWRVIDKFATMMNELGPRDLRGHYEIVHGGMMYRETLDGARTLIKKCKWDLDLALECVHQHFTHSSYNWKLKKGSVTFYAVLSIHSFPALLATARGAMKRRAKEVETQQGRVSSVDRRYLEAAHADTAI